LERDSKVPEPGLGWYFVHIELAAGGFPSESMLKYARLGGGHKTPEVIEFLSKLAAGEIKRPKGRPHVSRFEREVIGDYIRGVLDDHYEERKAARKSGEHFAGSPLDAAFELTKDSLRAEEMGYSIDTLRDIRLRRNGW
jgi:hypothetical protein